MRIQLSMSSLPGLRSATHVAFESFAVDRLSKLGATNVVRASDCLLIGPSRRDPSEHVRARQAWWSYGEGERWDLLYSPDIQWQLPVVAWVSGSLQERVNLWRACAFLHHLGITSKDLRVLELEPVPPRSGRREPKPPFECAASVSHHSDEVLLDHLAKAQPFPRARYDRAESLWKRFTADNPSPFVRSCRRGAGGFPELGPLWAFLSQFFPRKATRGTLRLNRFDDLLLRILSPEHQTPVKVFVHDSPMGVELRQLASCTGDLFVARRLDQWANHAGFAVECASGQRPDTPMLAFSYRITERGMRLREGGLTDLADAPSLPVAGIEVYAPSAPWVLLEDGRLGRA